MTDRELLEQAAKAIHLGHAGFHGGRGLRLPWYDGSPEADSGWWNPLADDGDALRLAVNLGLIIDTHGLYTRVSLPYECPLATECHGEDQSGSSAATRRAIVRAAAEMDKS